MFLGVKQSCYERHKSNCVISKKWIASVSMFLECLIPYCVFFSLLLFRIKDLELILAFKKPHGKINHVLINPRRHKRSLAWKVKYIQISRVKTKRYRTSDKTILSVAIELLISISQLLRLKWFVILKKNCLNCFRWKW